MEMLMEVIRAARNLRAEVGITPMRVCGMLYASARDDESRQVLNQGKELIVGQGWFEDVRLETPPTGLKRVESSVGPVDLYLPVEGVIDVDAERSRLSREQIRLEEDLAGIEKRLGNPQFLERAKPEAVEKARRDHQELTDRLAKVRNRLSLFS